MKANNLIGFVRTARWALGVAVLVCVGAAHAAGPLQITNAVYQEVEVRAPDGSVTHKRVVAERVVPGGEVIYEISYENTGTEPATEIAIDNPLPAEVAFVDAATEPTVVSVDGGQTFGELEALTVEGPDGEPRAAQPTVAASIAPVAATPRRGVSP